MPPLLYVLPSFTFQFFPFFSLLSSSLWMESSPRLFLPSPQPPYQTGLPNDSIYVPVISWHFKKKNVAVLVPSPSRITVTNIVEPLWGLCIISFRNNIFIFLPRVFWHLISLTSSLVLMWALKTLYHMRREDILKLDGHSFTPAMPM